MSREEINELGHELRGNLHAMELVIRVIEQTAPDQCAELAEALRGEVSQAKRHLEKLIERAQSTQD